MRNPKVRTLILALIIAATLLLGCSDNWDGMDRSGWDWSGGQAQAEVGR